jgi:catechol 2,3-dioxygenase-like lactoylglutathione lyase family enzyme
MRSWDAPCCTDIRVHIERGNLYRLRASPSLLRMAHLDLVTLVVQEYDPAIAFFVHVLQFELVEDVPSLTTEGRPKRWVVVRPVGGTTGLLLARADGEAQVAVVGAQSGGRVGFFLRVDDFDASYARMIAAGVVFVRAPRVEPYGRVAVFLDVAGNRWDLLSRVAGT